MDPLPAEAAVNNGNVEEGAEAAMDQFADAALLEESRGEQKKGPVPLAGTLPVDEALGVGEREDVPNAAVEEERDLPAAAAEAEEGDVSFKTVETPSTTPTCLPGGYRVFVRVRPMADEDGPDLVDVLSDTRLKVVRSSGDPLELQVDKVFGADILQPDVFQAVQDIVAGALEGYSGTILAYGQTGSGKTYTMTGDAAALTHVEGGSAAGGPHTVRLALRSQERGLIPRALELVFRSAAPHDDWCIYLTFMEVYGEKVYDLLAGPGEPSATVAVSREFAFSVRCDGGGGRGCTAQQRTETLSRRALGNSLDVKEARDGMVSVPGATVVQVRSLEQALEVLRLGTRCRTSGDNGVNAVSSRSHAIFQVVLERRAAGHTVRTAKLNLVDLAGSEKLCPHSALAPGPKLQELTTINHSLSVLGKCIAALMQQRHHVPYRDSKLTRLLQDSLRGQAQTAMYVCISPAAAALGETLSSLKFADRAKRAVVDRPLAGHFRPERCVEHLLVQLRRLEGELKAEQDARRDIERQFLRRGRAASEEARSSDGEVTRAGALQRTGPIGQRLPVDDLHARPIAATSGTGACARADMDSCIADITSRLEGLTRENAELRARLETIEGGLSGEFPSPTGVARDCALRQASDTRNPQQAPRLGGPANQAPPLDLGTSSPVTSTKVSTNTPSSHATISEVSPDLWRRLERLRFAAQDPGLPASELRRLIEDTLGDTSAPCSPLARAPLMSTASLASSTLATGEPLRTGEEVRRTPELELLTSSSTFLASFLGASHLERMHERNPFSLEKPRLPGTHELDITTARSDPAGAARGGAACARAGRSSRNTRAEGGATAAAASHGRESAVSQQISGLSATGRPASARGHAGASRAAAKERSHCTGARRHGDRVAVNDTSCTTRRGGALGETLPATARSSGPSAMSARGSRSARDGRSASAAGPEVKVGKHPRGEEPLRAHCAVERLAGLLDSFASTSPSTVTPPSTATVPRRDLLRRGREDRALQRRESRESRRPLELGPVLPEPIDVTTGTATGPQSESPNGAPAGLGGAASGRTSLALGKVAGGAGATNENGCGLTHSTSTIVARCWEDFETMRHSIQ